MRDSNTHDQVTHSANPASSVIPACSRSRVFRSGSALTRDREHHLGASRTRLVAVCGLPRICVREHPRLEDKPPGRRRKPDERPKPDTINSAHRLNGETLSRGLGAVRPTDRVTPHQADAGRQQAKNGWEPRHAPIVGDLPRGLIALGRVRVGSCRRFLSDPTR
jgi:hypothetical protein